MSFASDIDHAMYVTAQKRKSVRDEEFRAFLRGAGYSDVQIDAIGPRVTERIKQLATAEYDAGELSTTMTPPSPTTISIWPYRTCRSETTPCTIRPTRLCGRSTAIDIIQNTLNKKTLAIFFPETKRVDPYLTAQLKAKQQR